MLRIDSPGGSAIASDVIWREVMLTQNEKPLIASMSDVAASGGYYIAMPAHAIVAQPSTLTGSIGVVMLKFVIDGTLKKLGAEHGGRAAGQLRRPLLAGAPVLARGARRRSQEQMQATYDAFVEKAAAGAQHDAREDRRHRPGPRLDRAAGQGSSASSTSSAASIAPSRSPSSARRSRRTRTSSWWSTRPQKSFYDSSPSPFGRSEGDGRRARRDARAPEPARAAAR